MKNLTLLLLLMAFMSMILMHAYIQKLISMVMLSFVYMWMICLSLVQTRMLLTVLSPFPSTCFDLKDLEEANVILGINIARTKGVQVLTNLNILKKKDQTVLIWLYFVKDPVWSYFSLEKNKSDSVSQSEYAKILDNVIFVMNYTRFDIVYAASRLNRYTPNPSNDHWNALIRLWNI